MKEILKLKADLEQHLSNVSGTRSSEQLLKAYRQESFLAYLDMDTTGKKVLIDFIFTKRLPQPVRAAGFTSLEHQTQTCLCHTLAAYHVFE